ncbi:hypothetical protein EDB87DRAFT_19689 [Lactarius vividus]|nr:hypothetical protein EDB87DRAFT_19689 [Lactarius vividus]
MPPRIVSWSDNEIYTYPSHSQMSPIASEVRTPPSAEFGPEHISPQFSEGRKTLRGGHTTPDDSFIRHDVYFFKDGNVTFLVDGTLYCVHRYFFSRDSVYFSTRFTRLGVRDHEALPTIISLGDVERNDFEVLLSILYPTNFEGRELTYDQWKSVLQLSTHWGFTSLRKFALKSIKPPTSHDQFVLARTYSVDHWVLPALTALCERTLPLSLDEARQMMMEDVILVATVREEIRGGALRVDAADIPRHVAKAQQANLEIKADPKARAKAEANAKGDEEKAKLETESKANAEAEAKAKLNAEAKAKRKAEAKAKHKAEAKAKRIAETKETREVKAKAEAKEKREADTEVNAETEARERPEAEADGSPAQHPSTTNSSPHGSASAHPATSITAAPSSASAMSSPPTLVAQERKSINDRQDDERSGLTLAHRLLGLLGNSSGSGGDQATVALPAGAAAGAPDEAKSETAVVTIDKHVPSNATDARSVSEATGCARQNLRKRKRHLQKRSWLTPSLTRTPALRRLLPPLLPPQAPRQPYLFPRRIPHPKRMLP